MPKTPLKTVPLFTARDDPKLAFPISISIPIADDTNVFSSDILLGEQVYTIHGVDELQTLSTALFILKTHMQRPSFPTLFWENGTVFSFAVYFGKN